MKKNILKILSIGLLTFNMLTINTQAITKEESKQTIQMFTNNLPQILKDKIEGVSIKIQNNEEFNNEGYEYGIYENDGTAGYRGVSRHRENEIIRINCDTEKYIRGYGYDTFVHECFHSLDSYFSSSKRIWIIKYSDTDKFKALYNKYKDNKEIGEYYLTSSREFFAQCGMLYLNYPYFLKTEYPKVYTYMDNLINNYNKNK